MLRVIGVVILIICWHQTVDITQAQLPICTESGHQGKPDIWGDWVVWHDNREGDGYNIYGKNLSSGEEIQISDSNIAFCPSIHSELVVWQDKRNGDFDIYRYNLVTRTESPLYIADGNQVNPSIHGDTVVWRTGQYPSWPEIWGYSISESRAFLISDAPGNKWEPDVFRDVVVWGDYRYGNWDIYGYNLTTHKEFAIDTEPPYQRSVAIYGNTVVYENWRSSENQGVGIYNLITREHAYHPTPRDCEWLAIYGSIVVWGDYRHEGTDIYGCKISTGEEFRICTNVGWQYSPAIYRDTVVWSDDRYGGFSERDIYAAMVPKHLYVDANAFGSNDGATWADAYNCLQDALAIALSGDDIFVAAGTYKPDQGTNQTPGDRDATFQLISGVGIYGGFPPGGGQWENRGPNVHETKLSGDLYGNDVHVNEPCDLPDDPNRADNSYHVVTASGTDESAILDGFTITGGNAAEYFGSGMRNEYGSPTVSHCTFSGNWALLGGGMYNNESNLTLTNCTFSGNGARLGGGMYNDSGSPALTNCTISGNSARDGGGLYNCDGPIINCTIIGNSARELGGGLYNCDGSISNCIIWNNTAADLGDQFYQSDAITYSCVQGGSSGQGCISFNPCFVVPGYWDQNGMAGYANDDFWVDGDYRLKSRAGRWDSNSQTWVQDELTSPCIDAGDPNSDCLAELWPHDKRINMGAYGGTEQASMSLSNIGNIADLNNDDTVNFGDFAHFADSWQIEEVPAAEDLNRDNHVDIVDVMILCDNWLWERGGTLNVDLTVDNLWMYQNLPRQTESNLTANVSVRDDPMGNSSYTYEWKFILPSDVNIPPETVVGGEATDAFCTFAAPDCNEPNGISDSGQVFTVKVTVTGDDHSNTGTAQAEFGIALLGDVNNDCIVNVIDRAILTSFWRGVPVGACYLRDCDLNCDGSTNIVDRSIVTAIWRGTLCQNDVNEPCPYRSPCP